VTFNTPRFVAPVLYVKLIDTTMSTLRTFAGVRRVAKLTPVEP
jgi:hypothetical protein